MVLSEGTLYPFLADSARKASSIRPGRSRCRTTAPLLPPHPRGPAPSRFARSGSASVTPSTLCSTTKGSPRDHDRASVASQLHRGSRALANVPAENAERSSTESRSMPRRHSRVPGAERGDVRNVLIVGRTGSDRPRGPRSSRITPARTVMCSSGWRHRRTSTSRYRRRRSADRVRVLAVPVVVLIVVASVCGVRCTDPMNADGDCGGDFSSWMIEIQARSEVTRIRRAVRRLHRVHLVAIHPRRPDESDTIAHIRPSCVPARIAARPRRLGYDERGHCPMLIDGSARSTSIAEDVSHVRLPDLPRRRPATSTTPTRPRSPSGCSAGGSATPPRPTVSSTTLSERPQRCSKSRQTGDLTAPFPRTRLSSPLRAIEAVSVELVRAPAPTSRSLDAAQ